MSAPIDIEKFLTKSGFYGLAFYVLTGPANRPEIESLCAAVILSLSTVAGEATLDHTPAATEIFSAKRTMRGFVGGSIGFALGIIGTEVPLYKMYFENKQAAEKTAPAPERKKTTALPSNAASYASGLPNYKLQ